MVDFGMLRNLGPRRGAADPALARRLRRYQEALEGAEEVLCDSDPGLPDKKAKALSAAVRAASDIEAWRALVFGPETNSEDERAASRALQARIDRVRESHGLAPVFRDLRSAARDAD